MTAFLLYDKPLTNAELRHEIGEPIMDPIGFLDLDGKRIVLAGSLEEPILLKREDVVDEFVNYNELGSKQLVRDESFPINLVGAELILRGLRRFGVEDVIVPGNFSLIVADHLRENGVSVRIGVEEWKERRRRKTPWELEGIERAQRAADTAMLTAARMLRDAEPTGQGTLRFEGEILTSELIREAMMPELSSQGAQTEEILVQSGDACLDAHDIGTGPIRPNESVIIDCFPRDLRTGVYSDMTRTYVPGQPSEELVRLHKACRTALDVAFEAIRPGAEDMHKRVSDFFKEEGFPTELHNESDTPLKDGYYHSLGHGVGLEVHERPWLGQRSEPLVEGDVVAIEPGLYFKGIGGVRLEDTVLVTEEGAAHFTDPLPYDLEP